MSATDNIDTVTPRAMMLNYVLSQCKLNANTRLYAQLHTLFSGFFTDNVQVFLQLYQKREGFYYWAADKSLARPGRKQATATDFDFHMSYLLSHLQER